MILIILPFISYCMAGHKITHIRRKGLEKKCEAITNVRMDGKSVLVEDIIKMIQGKGKDKLYHTFYIEIEGIRVSVKLAPEYVDPTYIRTERTDSPYDNLLSLPKF